MRQFVRRRPVLDVLADGAALVHVEVRRGLSAAEHVRPRRGLLSACPRQDQHLRTRYRKASVDRRDRLRGVLDPAAHALDVGGRTAVEHGQPQARTGNLHRHFGEASEGRSGRSVERAAAHAIRRGRGTGHRAPRHRHADARGQPERDLDVLVRRELRGPPEPQTHFGEQVAADAARAVAGVVVLHPRAGHVHGVVDAAVLGQALQRQLGAVRCEPARRPLDDLAFDEHGLCVERFDDERSRRCTGEAGFDPHGRECLVDRHGVPVQALVRVGGRQQAGREDGGEGGLSHEFTPGKTGRRRVGMPAAPRHVHRGCR